MRDAIEFLKYSMQMDVTLLQKVYFCNKVVRLLLRFFFFIFLTLNRKLRHIFVHSINVFDGALERLPDDPNDGCTNMKFFHHFLSEVAVTTKPIRRKTLDILEY